MPVTIGASDARSIKALSIAAGASGWLKVWARDGRTKFYGVPSGRHPGVFHLVNCEQCSCFDARRHPGEACKHVLAVRLHCELVRAGVARAQPAPRRAQTRPSQ